MLALSVVFLGCTTAVFDPAETLLGLGWSVEVIDNLSTGSSENISHLRARPPFRPSSFGHGEPTG